MAGVYTDQRLNLSKLGKAFGRKPKFQTGPGKSGRPGLQGGFGKRKPWWDCEPVLQSKEQERKPLTYSGARPISIPVDLSSRLTQQVVRDLEIGQPINSENCSETAEGVARESEGRSRLSLLRAVRQDQPRGHPGSCVCPVPLQQGRTGSRWAGLRGHRGVWRRAVAWRTGACAPGGELPTGSYQKSVHPEGQRQAQAAGYRDMDFIMHLVQLGFGDVRRRGASWQPNPGACDLSRR